MLFKRIVPLFMGVCMCSVLRASELPNITFSIKPKLCILSKEQERCDDELQIKWQAAEPLSLCLFRSHESEPLHCWKNELAGRYVTAISTNEDVEFELRDDAVQELLVTSVFEVVQDNDQYRRRRRNPWSFF